MKLIQQNKLFFKEGNSDKVYEIDLCEVGTELFVVYFRYGRRNANLKEGTKTPTPVDRKKADEIFEALTAEKRKGGYQSETEMFQVLPVLTNTAPNTLEGTLLQRLQNAIDNINTFKTEWTTSRVAWRVGELRFKEAIPYLIKLVEKGDALQRYSIIWALARCADERAIPTFQAYSSNSKYPANVRKMANEGLLRSLPNTQQSTSNSEEKSKFVTSLVEKLPEEIKQYVLANQQKELKNCVSERLQETQTEYNFLENLYAVAPEFPLVQKTIAAVLTEIALRPPHFKYIRSIYKTAELRDDAQILGILAYRFEQTPKMYEGVSVNPEDEDEDSWYLRKFIPELDKEVHIKKEVKKKDSRIAFSDKTKQYFQKRMLRNLKNIGKTDGIAYIKLATATLLQYKTEDYVPPYNKQMGYGSWQSNIGKYKHTVVEIPACSKSLLLNQILLGNNPNLSISSSMEWQNKEFKTIYTEDYYYKIGDEIAVSQENSQDNSLMSKITNRLKNFFGNKNTENKNTENKSENETTEIKSNRHELYPEHWDKMPQAYIQLLLQAKLDLIHEFAYKNLLQHPDYEQLESKINEEIVLQLLNSSYEIPIEFGLEIAKKKFANHTDKKFILLLLNLKLQEARQFAMEIVEKYPSNFVQEIDFIIPLFFSNYKDVRVWAKNLLSKIYFSEDMQKILVGKSVVEMLAITENSVENNDKIVDVVAILLQIAPLLLATVSWKIVEELLSSPLDGNNVLASEILLLKLDKISADEIPFSILNAFFVSNSETLRKNGMAIFAKYPEQKLLEATDLLSNMLVSVHENIRTTAAALCKNLAIHNKDFAQTITNFLILASLRKETYENSHQNISDLLLHDFKNNLAIINLKTTLNLIYCNYRQGQFVGFHILQQHINTEEMTVRQIIALANHELLAIRHWSLAYFNTHIPRIRYEREEAIRLLDTKWDDSRKMAMEFFRTHFRQEDWDVDSLVSIADSIRPDVEAFGKELITKFFDDKDGELYLTKLSQHPSINMQLFASNYLTRFASDNLVSLQNLEFYFRSVLTRVNKARTVKDRVLEFLETEALKSEAAAAWVTLILNDMLATSAIQDKARFIEILQKLKNKFTNLEVALELS